MGADRGQTIVGSPTSPPHSARPGFLQIARTLVCFLLMTGALLRDAAALDDRKQISQYVQLRLTDKTGLPQNSVGAIAQTRDGYLWFGTQEGLARFDGVHLNVFDSEHHPELQDSFIKFLTASRDGSLWLGTRSGVTHLQNGVFSTVVAAQSPVNTIYESMDGNIWVGTSKGLYSIRQGVVHLVSAAEGLPQFSIQCIAQSRDGTLWLGTDKGLFALENGRFRAYTPQDGVPGGTILSLAAALDGSLWIASQEGLVHWRGKLLEIWPAAGLPPLSRISSLLVDRNGNIWIGFDHDGIATVRQGKLVRYTSHEGLANDDIEQIFEDRDGHLWIGFGEGGVLELRDGLFTNFGRPEGLSQDMVWTVLQARDGSVWVGTNSRGLDHIDQAGKVHNYTAHDGLAEGAILALCEGRDGSLWIGSERGTLSRLKDGHITNFSDPASQENHLQVILEDSAGELWLGFHEANGLVRFHEDRFHQGRLNEAEFQHYAVPGLINTAAFAPDGALWLGSDHGGVTRFSNGIMKTWTAKDGLLSNFAGAIYVDREGIVWAGTSPGGLNRIKNGHVTTYSMQQGLADLTVGAIVEDDLGNLWMTCNKGIYRVSKKELNDYAEGRAPSIHSVMYGTADGMRSAECNFGSNPSLWKGADGHLWFTTPAGLLGVDPAHSQTLDNLPAPRVEDVFFNHKRQAIRNTLIVGPGAGDLEIKFTAPDFTAPERLRFRYRLDEFDQDWTEAGSRREAFYTKVPPGHYTFLIQDAGRDGHWNSQSTRLDIAINPHLWQTEWFRALCTLLMLLVGAILYRVRIHFLLMRNHELEAKVGNRTRELQDALQAAAQARDALHEQATRDALTKLWNRRTILEILETQVTRAQREGKSICVLMADVDHFKRVNDTYGHVAGDRVLEDVAANISALIRPYDSAGRYGGEEFLIVLPGCTLADGQRRAEEFRSLVAATATATGSGAIEVTCSFGIASAHDASASQLILAADHALYGAKQAGRNRVHPPSGSTPHPASPADTGAKLVLR